MGQQSMVILGANEIMIKMMGQGIQARKERPEETSKIRKIRGTGVGVPPKDGKHGWLSVWLTTLLVVKEGISV